ncbi:hypothetical protein TSUD_112220 [Trifolium subterraneum]|uniref:CCHC-type domain-containing protein n=1 Tax=Trifolium subterraneum TaxID=3900 RepID=A0A2Z6NK18_TRISU|nr:hypothetical protein TSUD_112220 [Trifolium subterraneum]
MAESSNFLPPAIPKFDGFYDHWAMLMENLLRSKEFWGAIEDGVTVAPPNATAEQLKIANDSKLRDFKVKNYLFEAIDRSILETILQRDTAKEIWDFMRSKYQGSTKVKRAQLQTLRKDFEVLAMKESKSVDDYFARTLAIANRMNAYGERLEQVVIVEKVLRSLLPKFNYVVCSIEQSTDVTTLSVDALQSSLLVQEQRLKSQTDKEEEQALKVASYGRGNGGSCGRGRSSSRGRGRASKENVECYKCHKMGHYQSDCPSWGENDANYAAFDQHEEILLMAQQNVETNARDEVWFLDSGCSNHMIGTKEWLYDFDENVRECVKLGDDSRMEIKGKGNLKLCIGGLTQVITDVYYIPGLKNNLLSIGQLQQKNLTILFKQDFCKVYHPEKGLIISTKMSSNRIRTWQGLPQLQDMEDTCVSCLTGKQHMEAIPKYSNWRATKPLELVHSDICGPITPQSNGGSRYFITFTDDFSRKTWIYLLVNKASAFDEFKKFKTLVEKESNSQIMCLRTDRGREFTSNVFNEFCSIHGIKRQLTTAYTPQQNGVSERKNRTLLNMVRSMLAGINVPKTFWPEALKWTTYVLNRSPTLSVKDMTPEEAWSGSKPTVQHFRVFGCLSFVHIPDNHRKKLDSKSIKCILLGLSEESKGYKLYDPVSQRVIVSRDVIFDESKGWNDAQVQGSKQMTSLNNDEGTSQTNEDVEIVQNDEEYTPHETTNDQHNNDNNTDSDQYVDEESTDSDELPPRIGRKPGYLDHYTSGEEFDEAAQMQNLAMANISNDPITYYEAVKCDEWKQAMDQEIEAIKRNDTWELVSLPHGEKRIGVKWIYKTKYNEKGEIEKYKARLVAKGYSQQYGIDYNEVFAPVARWDTIRMVLSLAACQNWFVYQLDVNSAFLHGELTENVYIAQPLGYQKGSIDKVYKLKKALYGLKQAPRAWYNKIESYFNQEKFQKCPHEHTLFVKHVEDKILIVSLYVDDLIYTGNDSKLFEEFKHSMQGKFAMTDLGKMRYFLGVEVTQSEHGIMISQQKYAKEILARFGMEACNGVGSPIVPGNKLTKDENGKLVDATKYKQMVGCLMYLLATRPDLAYSVCLIARYMDKPTEIHSAAAKRILRYLKGSISLGVLYKRSMNQELVGWTDSDYAGDSDDRKSTSGYVFKFGSSAISWSSKKQPIVTLSTTEAEFVAAASCACQAIWPKKLMNQLGQKQEKCIVIYCDNSSSIKLSKNPVMHGRCKHIDVRYYFLRDLVKDGILLEMKHCSTIEQLTDGMTKALKLETFCKFGQELGMIDAKDLQS